MRGIFEVQQRKNIERKREIEAFVYIFIFLFDFYSLILFSFLRIKWLI